MRALIVTLILISPAIIFSQAEKDSVLLLNGKVYQGEVIGTDVVEGDSVLTIKTLSKKNETITEQFGLYRIFSYTQNGSENIVYTQNEFLGNYLSITETKAATYGSYDARKTFKPAVPLWTTFGICAGVSLLDTYLTQNTLNDPNYIGSETSKGFFKDSPSMFTLLVPVAASVVWSFPTFKLKKKNMIHTEYFNNENYYRGYHRIAKQKRMLGSLIGGFSGLALGIISYYTVQAVK